LECVQKFILNSIFISQTQNMSWKNKSKTRFQVKISKKNKADFYDKIFLVFNVAKISK